ISHPRVNIAKTLGILHEIDWLGGRDSKPDTVVQSHVSYRWTTSQYQPTRVERQELLILVYPKAQRQPPPCGRLIPGRSSDAGMIRRQRRSSSPKLPRPTLPRALDSSASSDSSALDSSDSRHIGSSEPRTI